ncbi:metal ABC transporter substrate-binding protein [Rhodoplanes azumiensis]|uniref:Metal ABC transporter substrate-binding protein n=1 Tax=Rhodoplanes azumiensis TaxID=1897628 RepID=A0ABW5AM33_9BRAD
MTTGRRLVWCRGRLGLPVTVLLVLSLLVPTAGVLRSGPAVAQGAAPARPPGAPLKVVTTFTVIADIAKNVAGDRAVVESITKPGAEIHDYQPTPQDIVRAQGADLVLWNGFNLERWFEKFLDNLREVPSVVVTEGITPLGIREGPYTGKPNPHAWMSPTNGLVYVENIRKALTARDPANAEAYARNAAAYAEQIKALDAPLRARLAAIPEPQRWLVTSEGAFSYLARDYRLREAYLWPINADEQGTPRQVRKVIDLVRESKIPVVFSESTISDKPARQVARETGARYGGVLYVDSLSAAGGPVPTYLDLLKVTVETIAKGFGQ